MKYEAIIKKKVKKYGNTLIISFTKEEVGIYGLNEDSVLPVMMDKINWDKIKEKVREEDKKDSLESEEGKYL